MIAEIIAVGTELLLGATANTDAMYISRELAALGIFVHHHTVVGDNEQRLKDAVNLAKTRADCIITTGGLGPTYDDMTKGAAASCFGLELEPHEPSLRKIYGYFANLGRVCTPNNEQQAWLPRGCTVFDNGCGTAPGCAFEKDGKHVIMLPGPPKECRAMFAASALPYLSGLSGAKLVSRFIRFFGIGESAIENKLRVMMENAQNPTIAPYAADGEAYLRVTARADTEEEAFRLTQPVVDEITAMFPGYIYGVDKDSLEAVLSERLRAKKMTVALAESCTGGLIAKRLTDIAGASEILWGGAVTYTNAAKEELLGVSRETLERHGAVSEPAALEMARGILARSGADCALSVTGLVGEEATAGEVFVCSVIRGGAERVKKVGIGIGRERGRTLAAGHALKLLLDEIDA